MKSAGKSVAAGGRLAPYVAVAGPLKLGPPLLVGLKEASVTRMTHQKRRPELQGSGNGNIWG